jgi:hypothetical protein
MEKFINKNRIETRNTKIYESMTETQTKKETRNFRPKSFVQPGTSWFYKKLNPEVLGLISD